MAWCRRSMDTKPFYTSKTLIFNVLAIAGLIANQFGFTDFQLDPEVAGMILAIVNGALRLTTTKAVGT